MPRRSTDLPTLQTFQLSEFIGPPGVGRWAYNRGEHVTILGPSGWGKTHLAYRLLGATARPRLPAIALVIKPRDTTVKRWSDELDMPRVHDWPLVPNPMRRRTNGYTVWPRSTRDPELDDAMLYRVCRKVLRHTYSTGDRILFTDEVAGICELEPPRGQPPLTKPLRSLWTRGRSLGAGVWAATQRPVDIPLHAYTNAHHLFLGNDPDARGRQRYAEISGIDGDTVRHYTKDLDKWHWLYIRREDRKFAIVGPD